MAYSIPSSLLVSALLLLLAATNPVAEAQLITSINATVGGRICCAAGGSCSTGAPAAVGAIVTLTCPSNILAQPINTTTGANGSFTITTSTLPGIGVFQLLTSILNPCTVRVQLNQTVCPQLTQAGNQIIVLVVQFIQAILMEFGTLVVGILPGLL